MALNPEKPVDSLKIMRKIGNDLRDGVPSYQYAFGKVYSRIPGEKDRALFSWELAGVSTTKTLSADASSYSYKSFHKEVLLYTDLNTGELIHSWRNPWTDKECKVIHIANDPVNFVLRSSKEHPFKLPGKIVGDKILLLNEVPLFYPNPLGGAYQNEVGGAYHATEMFLDSAPVEEALDPNTTCVNDVTIGWSRVCSWLPWMEMGDRFGSLLFRGAGKRMASFNELPQEICDVINEKYPEYKTPPPLDDDRPNETSWIYYKRIKTGEKTYPWD